MVKGPGWLRIGPDPAILAWAEAARGPALAALTEAEDWRCGATWWPGIDALPNGRDGAIGGVGLPGSVRSALLWQPAHWHPAQLSTVRPGYPQPWPPESETAFHYRVRRDAAHVDGLLPIGPDRRRHLREPHAFILGLPLTDADEAASPLTVWEGSHDVMRRAFAGVLGTVPAADWPDVDLTEVYHAARREVFATCPRVTLPARPGSAILLHRLTLHGVAPWADGTQAEAPGRIVAYFRPEFTDITDWLRQP